MFLDLVPLSCITKNGKQSHCFGRALEDAQVIAVAERYDWSAPTFGREVRETLDHDMNATLPLLCVEQLGEIDWLDIIKALFVEDKGILISSSPGVIFDLLKSSAASQPKPTSSVGNPYYLSRFNTRICSPHSHHAPVLVHSVGSSLTMSTFNALHPLVSFIFGGDDKTLELRKNIFMFLDERLDEVFEELTGGTALIMKFTDGKYIDRESYPNIVLTGVLKREPGLLDSLRSAFEDTWREAQEKGVIDKNAEFPGLTAEDLPWFWSYEEKQGAAKARRGGRRNERRG